jgi:hypothetical protein
MAPLKLICSFIVTLAVFLTPIYVSAQGLLFLLELLKLEKK